MKKSTAFTLHIEPAGRPGVIFDGVLAATTPAEVAEFMDEFRALVDRGKKIRPPKPAKGMVRIRKSSRSQEEGE